MHHPSLLLQELCRRSPRRIFVHDEVILSGYGRLGITFRSLSHTLILYMYKYIYKMMFVCIDGGKILFRSLQRDTLLRNSLV